MSEKEARDKIMQLQQVQQQMQALTMQKQTMQMQQGETENALSELEKLKNEKVYELIGNLLINKKPQELKESLKDKKEKLDLRIESVDKQLKRITTKAQELQQEIMTMTKEGNK
jgi:prefoldin beta subunit